jgi:hypothetical protein
MPTRCVPPGPPLAPQLEDPARLVFTAHSIPTSADAAAGPPEEGGHRYCEQIAEAARLVAVELGVPERGIGSVARAGCTVNGAPCAVNCCAPAPRPGPDRVDC